jgi:multiple sugar transport system permease protein
MSQTTASRPGGTIQPARDVQPQRPRRRRLRRRHVTGLVFAAPLIVYLLLFYAYPLAVNVSMSLRRFTRATYVTGEAPFAGAGADKGRDGRRRRGHRAPPASP